MQTCSSLENPEDLPIPCMIAVHEADGPIDGAIWAFYPHRCLAESQYPLTPGMPVSLTLHLSESAAGPAWTRDRHLDQRAGMRHRVSTELSVDHLRADVSGRRSGGRRSPA